MGILLWWGPGSQIFAVFDDLNACVYGAIIQTNVETGPTVPKTNRADMENAFDMDEAEV